jgi:20S proteasome subunit alpha 7
MVAGCNRRIFGVDRHCGMAVTGTAADGRQLVNRAREEAGSYEDTYGSKVVPSVLSNRLANFVHYFTIHGSLRPFGTAGLIASYDEDMKTPELYMVEPSGNCLKYFACAAGKGAHGARTELEKILNNRAEEGITCKEAIDEAARVLHVIRDPTKDRPFELEMGWLSEANGYKYQLVPADIVKEADEKGKASIAEGTNVAGAAMDTV